MSLLVFNLSLLLIKAAYTTYSSSAALTRSCHDCSSGLVIQTTDYSHAMNALVAISLSLSPQGSKSNRQK